MPEGAGQHEPPTYFANIVTTILNVDGMMIELRQYLPAHAEVFKNTGGELAPIPPPRVEEVYKVAPVARVVLTFSAVRVLKTYLDQALPQMEAARKAGQ